MIDDISPTTVAIGKTWCTARLRKSAAEESTPALCNPATASNIPRKKSIVGMSIVLTTRERRLGCSTSRPRLRAYTISVMTHSTASDSIMPMYGGNPVRLLNTGTNNNPATPTISTARLSAGITPAGSVLEPICATTVPPPRPMRRMATAAGMASATAHGSSRRVINGTALPPVHSMIVVTSPMGDQAPPQLAAMIITLANHSRSCVDPTRRRMTIIIMIVVVMLSSTADIKNVITAIIHSRRCPLRVEIRPVRIEKPPWASIMPTIVIAPIRNINVWHVSPRCDISSDDTSALPDSARTDHTAADINSATAALSIFNLLSKAMHA